MKAQLAALVRKWKSEVKNRQARGTTFGPTDKNIGFAQGLEYAIASLEETMGRVERERIQFAAIETPEVIYCGRNHARVIADMKLEGISPRGCPQGFVTTDGRFVDRVEAARIAIAAGQIKKLRYHKTKLFSEELL